MMKKKLDAANFQLKDIFFRVCKRIQNNGEVRMMDIRTHHPKKNTETDGRTRQH